MWYFIVLPGLPPMFTDNRSFNNAKYNHTLMDIQIKNCLQNTLMLPRKTSMIKCTICGPENEALISRSVEITPTSSDILLDLHFFFSQLPCYVFNLFKLIVSTIFEGGACGCTTHWVSLNKDCHICCFFPCQNDQL